ncbi:MAG: nitrile hydratase subunit alpha, partial [Mesorhizobium sp.]
AWNDPAYAEWLKRDATAAIASLGYTGRQGEHMQAVFNTHETHNLVVCTLCSCYPWSVLGLPPVWYKAPPYRSRAVIDPRGVLEEFGLTLPAGRKIRVWDSTAELRYLVVPM